MMKAMPSVLFSCRCQTRTPLQTFHAPCLRTQALERIERYFEDYKSQIVNRLAGIGQPAKG